MPKQKLETTGQRSIEWAAGLFEGEGCLTFTDNKTRTGWEIRIKMTDLDVILMFHEAIGYKGNLGRFGKSPSNKSHHKNHITWSTAKRHLIKEIVDLLYPYMGKRRQEKMNEFLDWYVQQEKQG